MIASEPFDERPAALLAQELRFDYFRGLLTTSFSIMGGAVALKGLLIPNAELSENFFLGSLFVITGGLVAFEGQGHVIRNLATRRASSNFRRRLAMMAGTICLGLGTGILVSYFLNNFTSSGS